MRYGIVWEIQVFAEAEIMPNGSRMPVPAYFILEDVEQECRKIVDDSIQSLYSKGIAPEYLFVLYKTFSSIPHLVSYPQTDMTFNALDYAWSECVARCVHINKRKMKKLKMKPMVLCEDIQESPTTATLKGGAYEQ